MTIFQLQQSIVRRMEDIFKDYTPYGSRVAVHVYSQIPPQPQTEKDDIYPLCLVRLEDGEDGATESIQDVSITLGIRDSDVQFRGYETICSMIERIRLSLGENPVFDDMFEVQKPIRWTPSVGDETHSVYTGGFVLKFVIPSIHPGYNPLI